MGSNKTAKNVSRNIGRRDSISGLIIGFGAACIYFLGKYNQRRDLEDVMEYADYNDMHFDHFKNDDLFKTTYKFK